MAVQMEPSWKAALAPEFEKPYFHNLRSFLTDERAAGAVVYPRGKHIFRAFDLTPLDQVRVVILGQDPYHGPGQAHGLCFSVQAGTAPPPSLVNIYKELESDLGLPPPTHGDLTHWARQGVLLLNAILTVRRNEAGSHRGRGWETFTDAVVDVLTRERQNVVYLLWGRFAQNKAARVDNARNLLLKAAHPSPLSAHAGFLGCRHFSKANAYLAKQGLPTINWQLPPQPELRED